MTEETEKLVEMEDLSKLREIGPYRAWFGAIHHEDVNGFLFTVTPPAFASDVADALNAKAREASLIQRVEAVEGEAVWPAWASGIRTKLIEYGAEPDDEDGTCDLLETFNAWVDDYAVAVEARALSTEAALAGMREALEPFAAMADKWSPMLPDGTLMTVSRFNVYPHQRQERVGLKLSDFHAARQALAVSPPLENKGLASSPSSCGVGPSDLTATAPHSQSDESGE